MRKVWILMAFFLLTSCGAPEEPAARSGVEPVRPAANPEAVPDPDPRPIILAFGDSLTAGYGLPPGSGYPERLQEELDKRGYAYRVVNAGVSGDTSGGGLARMAGVLQLHPSVVILELGANDGLQGIPTESTRANLDEMISAFRKEGAQVVLAGMTLPRNFGADYVGTFEKMFPELAKKHGVTLIPFFLEGAVGHSGLMLEDGIHPNAEGYRVLTEMVLRYVEPLLKKEEN
jgi:acyl-CoA thioesterase I